MLAASPHNEHLSVEQCMPGGHDVLEGSAAREVQEGAPTGARATEAYGSPELLLALRHAGVVKGELLTLMHMT